MTLCGYVFTREDLDELDARDRQLFARLLAEEGQSPELLAPSDRPASPMSAPRR